MSQGQLEVTDVLGRRIVTIERDPFTIGRAAGSDLHLPSAEVSRDHAEIVSEADGYAIRDRGSRYGTYVNDDAVEVRPLVHGDRIRLGRSGGAEIVFLLSGADPALERGSGAVGDLKQVAALLEGLRALSSARVLDDVLTSSWTRRSMSAAPSAASSCWPTSQRSSSSRWGVHAPARRCPGAASKPAGRSPRKCSRPGRCGSRPISWMAIWPTSTWGRSRSGSGTCCVSRCDWCDTPIRPRPRPRIGALGSSIWIVGRKARCCCRQRPQPSKPWRTKLRWPSRTPSSIARRWRRQSSSRKCRRRPRSNGRCFRPPSNRIVLRRCGGDVAMPVDRRRLLRLHRPA